MVGAKLTAPPSRTPPLSLTVSLSLPIRRPPVYFLTRSSSMTGLGGPKSVFWMAIILSGFRASAILMLISKAYIRMVGIGEINNSISDVKRLPSR